MKRKKLFSTAVAGTLVAAQMVMPVMAADGGEMDVDVTTKTAIIRVEVPTSLAIAVNQFEKDDTGSQIYSDPFPITNKSEIPVKVSVTSTANLAATNPISLVATKEAAEESASETGEAWLAVAAQTSDGKYIEEAGKTIADLDEASENVTTFVQGTEDATKSTATASQVFYLDKAASSTVTYKGFVPTADGKADVSYAQFYELTELTLTGGSEAAGLTAAAKDADIYEMASGTFATDSALTLTAKKGGTPTYASGKTYYKAAATPTATASLVTTGKYVYGEDADGGKAAFRYMGRLSEGKESWTATDISKIKIAYDIAGVTGTRYDEVKDDCTYGLYASGDIYADATSINLDKGSSAVYANYSALGFAASDVKSCVVKVDSADYAAITPVSSTTTLKFNIGSTWNSATSVKIYVVTDAKVYVYTYK